MGVTWTEEQQKVITLRDRNILVSAAAGSGKTAVLVQRILSMIMDPDRPIDIDKLLIMTFTRAAAGEMKERISKAIEEALFQNPENEHLQRQLNLIHTAQITTIDGFCSYLIRNYFHLIELDPGYRVGDEGEMKLLKEDVIKELLEDYYSRGDKEFHYFIECYASGKTDEGIGEMIEKLYRSAMSHPNPEEWLQRCLKDYQITSKEEFLQASWIQILWKNTKNNIEEALRLILLGKDICGTIDGPILYDEALSSDLLFLEEVSEAAEKEDYDKLCELMDKLEFARLSGKRQPQADPQKKEQVKLLREQAKDLLKELKEQYFIYNIEETIEILRQCGRALKVLVELTLEFKARFEHEKREKNLLDFTDMEHFALKILMEQDGDEWKMSQAARELSEKYEEVLVDEYQDSNFVQELLTKCVSGWAKNKNNIFMVGDVKQSIYRFRLANPELFMEKYHRFTLEDSENQRIDLHKNFRSRAQVLESVNYIFYQIMGEDLGGVQYDEAAALHPGAIYPESYSQNFAKTEVLLIEKDNEEIQEELENQNSRELEALAIARKIQNIVGVELVTDKKTGEYRPAEYGDIVVLLRTASGWVETFRDVFSAEGIPSYTSSKTGYFSATEVVTVMNYLKICDNPLQDIPMTGVLYSPIGAFSVEELAKIRSAFPEGKIYDSLQAYVQWEEAEESCKEKIENFLKQLKQIRVITPYTPVHMVILKILEQTGYGIYAKALPDGGQRSANLNMLVEKAMEYEKTSYRGLFNFVRYIEKLQKYEVDYGEVNMSDAGKGVVQIMTIHKSKGLEFPIVFAAGMGKQFNFSDMNEQLLIHPDFGLGTEVISPKLRTSSVTITKQIIRQQLLEESLGEELRVLYVALTRAKEKLILSGTIGNLEKYMEKLAFSAQNTELLVPFGTRVKGRNYWDYILPALARHPAMRPILNEYGIFSQICQLDLSEAMFEITKVTVDMLLKGEILKQVETELQRERLENWNCEKIYNDELQKELCDRFGFVYPWEYLRDIPVKLSVSDLKKQKYVESEERETNIIASEDSLEEEAEAFVPDFMKEKEEAYTGSARGTAYHRFMECLDYSKLENESELQKQLEQLQQQKKLSQAEAQSIKLLDIRRFCKNNLGKRMQAAALRGELFREQPFVISRAASEVQPEWGGNEQILIQGIIDAYFIEDNKIILVDYKTDHAGEKLLRERYTSQLMDYADALNRMTGKEVKEKIIYSFTLNKAIIV